MVNLILSSNTFVAQFSDREDIQSENVSTFRVSPTPPTDKSVVNASGPTRSEQSRQGGVGRVETPQRRPAGPSGHEWLAVPNQTHPASRYPLEAPFARLLVVSAFNAVVDLLVEVRSEVVVRCKAYTGASGASGAPGRDRHSTTGKRSRNPRSRQKARA